ncbi:uncharacterized protein HaLaN_11598 [Haematococcus lacustris]|uniref:Importin N-terminal domain-containing protein n=1 Tax=Haematococcus lacustris TaxID=44745 RepID=A0A699Z816_HAELA|nr:uncharacterized protein HaLaN_11598 [Haematococcus lacustris]
MCSFDEAVAGRLEGERESTDACNRLGHLVKALAKVPHQVLEPVAKDWVPLLLEYAAAAKATAGEEDGTSGQ